MWKSAAYRMRSTRPIAIPLGSDPAWNSSQAVLGGLTWDAAAGRCPGPFLVCLVAMPMHWVPPITSAARLGHTKKGVRFRLGMPLLSPLRNRCGNRCTDFLFLWRHPWINSLSRSWGASTRPR